MRVALLIAASALVAACSSGSGEPAERAEPTAPSSSPRTSAVRPAPAPGPTSAPGPNAPIADVVRWIETGTAADVAGYHSMTRGGETTALGDGVAFVTAGAEANCVTNRYRDGALSCLVALAAPPPRPAGIEAAWKGNWVDFGGTTVDVGSPHGDPGPFGDGRGAELPAGQTLAFGDYRCRAAAVGLYCVDYAHQTAVALSAGGVTPFGCLRTTTPPPDVGLRFSC